MDKLLEEEKVKMQQSPNSLEEENHVIIDVYLKNLQKKVIQDVLFYRKIENKAHFESFGVPNNQNEDIDDRIMTIKEVHRENKSNRTETLKLGDNLEEKINKLIFKEIKDEELNFIQRKVSQEIKNKRHSIHHKTIISGVSNISKVQKVEEIVVGRSRRSSSLESISTHHKHSNESNGMSKFGISAKK